MRLAATILCATLVASLIAALPARALTGSDADPSIGGASAEAAARRLRAAGCDGHAGQRAALRSSAALTAAAARWSHGASLKSAIERAAYREEQSAALHVSGDSAATRQAVARNLCAALTDPRFSDIGSVQRGRDTWIVIAVPFAAPTAGAADEIAAELLRRINSARAQPRRCGSTALPAAAPLQPNSLLAAASRAHAQDMLEHDYFAHEGADGSSPADRVASTGYRHRIVGENIAEGPVSAAEAVQGWLQSPGHCQNIMDSRFRDTGFAFAANSGGEPRIYWVEVFAAPR